MKLARGIHSISLKILIACAITLPSVGCGTIGRLASSGTHITNNLLKAPSRLIKKQMKSAEKTKQDYYLSSKVERISGMNQNQKTIIPGQEPEALSAEEALLGLESDLPALGEETNISEILSIEASKYAWKTDAKKAIKISKQENRPLLFYFLYSGGPGTHQSLNAEVFSSKKFTEIIEKYDVNLVRLDYGSDVIKNSEDYAYYKKLKKYFNVRGYPTIVIKTPDGREIHHESGYNKGSDYVYLLKLKSRFKEARQIMSEYEKMLSEKGYRNWSNSEGENIFAKLIKTDKNYAYFKLRYGKTAKAPFSNLSKESLAEIAK